MSYGRDEHFQAVGFVGNEVEEMEGLIKSALEKAQQIVGMTVNAVGESPETDAGRQALGLAAALSEQDLPDAIQKCEALKAELIRYGEGF